LGAETSLLVASIALFDAVASVHHVAATGLAAGPSRWCCGRRAWPGQSSARYRG